MGVREGQKTKEDPNALRVNNISYIISFYRFPQCVISTTSCTVGTSTWLCFPDVNRNLDIFKGLATKT